MVNKNVYYAKYFIFLTYNHHHNLMNY